LPWAETQQPSAFGTGILRRLKALLQHELTRNIAGLSGIQVTTLLVPLITIPYLTRVLGPSSWGLLAFAQAFGGYLMVVIEYGFAYSATREIARFREEREKVQEILSEVLGAKAILTVASLVVAMCALRWVPYFRQHPALLWAALCWAVCQGFTMLWYFQGIERIGPFAKLDMTTKILAAAGVFIVVHHPSDDWKVLALQAGAGFISATIAMGIAYSETPFAFPRFSSAWKGLRMGWTMFFFKSSLTLYTIGNAFVLGLFAPTDIVGYYAAAEKISRAAFGLLTPVNQAIYPRVVHLIHRLPLDAARLVRRAVVLLGIAGGLIGVLLFAFAPWIVRIALGKSYDPVVPMLEVLALLPLLISLSCVLGLLWMLPLGMDRAFNTIILTAGLLNVGLAILLAPAFAGQGMAWAVVTAELYVLIAMFYWLSRKNEDPFRFARAIREQGN
jgi:polysaccharide transporter, PST family